MSNVGGSNNAVEYLRGTGTTDNNECSALFKEYSACLQVKSLESQPTPAKMARGSANVLQ